MDCVQKDGENSLDNLDMHPFFAVTTPRMHVCSNIMPEMALRM